MAIILEFDRGDIWINGSPSREVTEGSVAIHNNARDVLTIDAGWAGFSKGALMGDITVTRSVPKIGFASFGQDLVDAVTNTTPIQIVAICGAWTFTVTGIAKTLSRSFGEAKTADEPITVSGAIDATPTAFS